MTERPKPLGRVLRAYGVTAAVGIVASLMGRSERIHPGDVLIDAVCGPLVLGFVDVAIACAAGAVLGLAWRRSWSTWLGCAAVGVWIASGWLTTSLRVT